MLGRGATVAHRPWQGNLQLQPDACQASRQQLANEGGQPRKEMECRGKHLPAKIQLPKEQKGK